MEESKKSPKSPRTLDGVGGGASGSSAKSSHVIDLRQAKPKTAAGAPPASIKPPVKKEAPKKAEPKPEPVKAVTPSKTDSPKAAPVAEPEDLGEPFTAEVASALDTPARKGRFWPAFWRFLLLLILLGVILSGSIYLYLNYYRAG